MRSTLILCALIAGCLLHGGMIHARVATSTAPDTRAIVTEAGQGALMALPNELTAVRPMLISGVGIMQVPDLEQHLNAILARLEEQLPGPHPTLHVYLTPVRSFIAEGGPAGGIFVSMGTVRATRSDDSIAFVLGHELAHIWLGHFSHRTGTWDWERSMGVLTQAGLRIANHGTAPDLQHIQSLQALQQPAARNLAAELGSQEAADALLFPSWAREQESEADKVGVDLMAASGYSPAGIDDVFDQLEAMDRARQAELARAEAAARASDESAIGKAKDLNAALTAGVMSLFNRANRSVSTQMQDASNQHGAASGRHDRLAAYIDQHYPDVPATLQTASWSRAVSDPDTQARLADYAAMNDAEQALFAGDLRHTVNLLRRIDAGPIARAPRVASLRARLLTTIGRPQMAQQTLISSIRENDVPLDNYVQLIRLDLQAGQVQQADAAMRFANGMLGSPREMLPTDLQVLRSENNQILMSMTLLRCQVAGLPELAADCRHAAGR